MGEGTTARSCLSTLRRAVAVVCALAFLVVGLAHTVHDFGSSAAATIPAAAADSGLQQGTSEPAKHSRIGIEHCHACEIVVMTVADEAAPAVDVAREVPVAPLAGIRAHTPAAETRPPIVTL